MTTQHYFFQTFSNAKHKRIERKLCLVSIPTNRLSIAAAAAAAVFHPPFSIIIIIIWVQNAWKTFVF